MIKKTRFLLFYLQTPKPQIFQSHEEHIKIVSRMFQKHSRSPHVNKNSLKIDNFQKNLIKSIRIQSLHRIPRKNRENLQSERFKIQILNDLFLCCDLLLLLLLALCCWPFASKHRNCTEPKCIWKTFDYPRSVTTGIYKKITHTHRRTHTHRLSHTMRAECVEWPWDEGRMDVY